MSEDVQFIMREYVKVSKVAGGLQTILGFVWWLSIEHPEIFTEYLESEKK